MTTHTDISHNNITVGYADNQRQDEKEEGTRKQKREEHDKREKGSGMNTEDEERRGWRTCEEHERG